MTYSGFLNGDGPSNIPSATPVATTAATASSPAGSYAIALTGGSSTNYTIADNNGALTITAAALTVKADDRVINDDDALPALTSTITGYKNGDNSSIISTGPVYTVNPVYKKEAPGIYTITPSALVLKVPNNYVINYLPGNLYVNEEEGAVPSQ